MNRSQESYFTYFGQEQSLIDHDIHFRAGVGADGSDTFTPRTVIYDLKGGFGSLRKINALYEISDANGPVRGLWDGPTSTTEQQVIQPTSYQQRLDQGLPTFQLRDQDIRYWSDFNRVFYHPRSIVQLNDYELNSQIMPFENWSAGQDLFRSLDKEFDLIDRDIRPFIEECDQMQGLQVLTSTDDAWGGFAANYMENLRDEYGKTGIWIWGIESGEKAARDTQITRIANITRSVRSLATQATVYVRAAVPPLHVPSYIHLDRRSDWQKTALLCSAMESVTLPSRLRENRSPLDLLGGALNTSGNQTLAELYVSIARKERAGFKTERAPNGEMSSGSATTNGRIASGRDLTEKQTDVPKPMAFDINFSSEPEKSDLSHVFAQVESHRHKVDGDNSTQSAALDFDERMRHKVDEDTIVQRFDINMPFPLLDTFPETLFNVHSGSTGVEVSAGLCTNTNMRRKIMSLRDLSQRSIEIDEREVMYNDLTELANNYHHGWDSGTDSGEDS